jgi:hypothetical protein
MIPSSKNKIIASYQEILEEAFARVIEIDGLQ